MSPRLGRLLPDAVSAFYFEVHYDAKRVGQLRDLLVQVPISPMRPPRCGCGSIAELTSRLHEWFAESSLAVYCQPSAWLELDGVGSWADAAPGLSVCVDPAFDSRRPPTGGVPGLSPATIRALVDELGSVCAARSDSGAVVERIASAWPRAGRVRHLSIMSGRAKQPRKVYGILPRSDLVQFLREIHWPGDLDLVIDLGSALNETSSNVQVDLTATSEGVLPRMAFEFFSDPPPYADFFRTALLERAQARGLVDQEGVSALREWVGEFRGCLGHDAKPSRVSRWFDLKVVVDGGRPLLKAYLGARLTPVTI